MTNDKIYIIDGGVFSPPTRVVGSLAYNIASFILSLNNKSKIEYNFIPTNKYYNKPWVRCVDEDERIHMLNNLVTFINKEYNVDKNIKFVVNDYEIKEGKKRKEPLTTLETLNSFKSKKIYIALNTENMLVRVKGNRTDSLNIIFKAKCICYDIYSPELIGVDNIENYIYKSIDLQSLLETANNKFPSQVKSYFKKHKISNNDIKKFITHHLHKNKFEGLKNLVMKQIIILPKDLVPTSYKAYASNRLREELDVYYSSLENIKKYTTPGISNYITSRKLYHHCKSTYKDKLISKKSLKTKKNKRSESKRKKHLTKKRKSL